MYSLHLHFFARVSCVRVLRCSVTRTKVPIRIFTPPSKNGSTHAHHKSLTQFCMCVCCHLLWGPTALWPPDPDRPNSHLITWKCPPNALRGARNSSLARTMHASQRAFSAPLLTPPTQTHIHALWTWWGKLNFIPATTKFVPRASLTMTQLTSLCPPPNHTPSPDPYPPFPPHVPDNFGSSCENTNCIVMIIESW